MLDHRGSLFIMCSGKSPKSIKTPRKSGDLNSVKCFLKTLFKILVSFFCFYKYPRDKYFIFIINRKSQQIFKAKSVLKCVTITIGHTNVGISAFGLIVSESFVNTEI